MGSFDTDKTGGYSLPVFPYRRAPELDTGTRRYDVVIIGAGLAGLTAAVDLSLKGVHVVVLDEDDTVGVRGASSRGICYAQRTLEIFERFGIAERIHEKGVSWSVSKTLSGSDVVCVTDLSTDHVSSQPPFINIQQFYVEWFLVDRFDELGVGEIRWRNKVVDVTAFDQFTRLSVNTPDGDYELEATWVLDAEGANSFVRERLGLPVQGERGSDRWCITDVRFKRDVPHERLTWIDAPFNEGRAVWQHKMADDVWRLDFQMDPDCDPAEVSREEVAQDRVRQMLGSDTEFELVWVGPYFYRTQLMDSFRYKHLIFLGDAAHVKSPFGARGGNSGIQDADNLGWKLSLVLRGVAGEALLESYDEERRAAAVTNIRITQRSGRFVRPPTRAENLMRRAAISLAKCHAFARPLLNTGRLCTAHNYSGMSLIGNSPHDGRSVPSVSLSIDGRRTTLMNLCSEAGDRLLVILYNVSPSPDLSAQQCQALEAELPVLFYRIGKRLGELTFDTADLSGLFGLAKGGAAVLRPDSHLAAVLERPTLPTIRDAVLRALGLPVAVPSFSE
ncbi:FAD-dependent oxidoreductase [Paraburkholderia caffeinilytica]|uniref:FAD-dependent oxidoreductase n=1 Tax=Paraburkholderia caffeinilytica TaxID=1761016 RepID=UPI003DA1C385